VPVTKLNSGEITHRWPQVLPGSQAVLFTAVSAAPFGQSIDVISLKTGERKTIQREGFSARYLADATGSSGTGHMIFLREPTLFAVPFDPGHLAPTSAHSGGCWQLLRRERGFCVRGGALWVG